MTFTDWLKSQRERMALAVGAFIALVAMLALLTLMPGNRRPRDDCPPEQPRPCISQKGFVRAGVKLDWPVLLLTATGLLILLFLACVLPWLRSVAACLILIR